MQFEADLQVRVDNFALKSASRRCRERQSQRKRVETAIWSSATSAARRRKVWCESDLRTRRIRIF